MKSAGQRRPNQIESQLSSPLEAWPKCMQHQSMAGANPLASDMETETGMGTGTKTPSIITIHNKQQLMRQGNNEIDSRATAKCNKSFEQHKKSSVKRARSSSTTTQCSTEEESNLKKMHAEYKNKVRKRERER